MSSSTRTQNLYSPGNYLRATDPITVAQFQDPNDLSCSIPFNLNTNCSLDDLASGATVTNYTGKDIVLAVSRPLGLPREKWENERDILETDLYKGNTLFVPFPPIGYTVSVLEFSIDVTTGARVTQSDSGIPLSQIEGRHISVYSAQGNGEVKFGIGNSSDDKYTSIKNFTRNSISIKVVKDKNPMATEEQEQCERVSRNPDYGGQKVDEAIVYPGATHRFLPSPELYVVRFFETADQQSGKSTCTATGRVQSPSKLSYVELGLVKVRPGEAVVAFVDNNRNGAIYPRVYSQADIKLVSSDLVQNGRIST